MQSVDGSVDCFTEDDFLRAHSSWLKHASLQVSKFDDRITLTVPDTAGKCSDLRLDHLLVRQSQPASPQMNRVWHYPHPSSEVEARRVLDLWRGAPAAPWSSRQEAHQHFRKAFAFLDTDGDGRVNYLAFRAGLLRLRYPLSEPASRRLFDRIAAARAPHITARDLAAPILNAGAGSDAPPAAPRGWLGRSRLLAFDTARVPRAHAALARALHGRRNVHNGRLHPADCARPCCAGDVATPGYFGAPVHGTYTSHASETPLGDRNR